MTCYTHPLPRELAHPDAAFYAAQAERSHRAGVRLYDASPELLHAIAHRNDPWAVRAA